jgi:hypothetical protein
MPQDWEAVKASVSKRSVHAAPFPCTETIESIGTLFSKFGTINQVRLLRAFDAATKHAYFGGSVVVEMSTQEEADALLEASIEHGGAILRLQSKAAYLEALREVRPSRRGLPLAGEIPNSSWTFEVLAHK